MAGFVHTANHGQLIIVVDFTGYPLMNERWRCMNLADVQSVTHRGSSVIIPTAAGRKPRRRYIDESIVTLEMLVRSDAGPGGSPVDDADRFEQLATNTALLANIATPPPGNTGRSAVYTPGPGASNVYASVFVENFTVTAARELGGLVNRVTFDLVNPAGVWS